MTIFEVLTENKHLTCMLEVENWRPLALNFASNLEQTLFSAP